MADQAPSRPDGHTCHARGCDVPVSPRQFMCRKDWLTLPKPLRDWIWATYRPGQEVTKTPSAEYLSAARACVDFLAWKQGVPYGTP